MYCMIILLFIFLPCCTRAEEIGNTSEDIRENVRENNIKWQGHDGSTSFMGSYGRSSKKEDNVVIEKEWQIALAEVPEETLFVAGLPDNSDECFSRFANVFVVDANPYKHSKGTSLAECKTQCLQLHQQLEACASFVYDKTVQECDIFTQRGDVAPSWLIDFQSRDYFEPNFGIGCSKDQSFEFLQSTTAGAAGGCTKCESGKVSRFTRIEGYELFESNDENVEGTAVEKCIRQCDSDKGNCLFSSEQAFPVGNGRLKRNKDAAYYEKLCVDERLARNCERIFHRFPQMVLVGYAETVTDAPNFETCIERCIDSLNVYGYNCTSGMYYFEEKQLNCILNAENRMTKEALFADEFEEIVDYFEISCGERNSDSRK